MGVCVWVGGWDLLGLLEAMGIGGWDFVSG